MAKFVIVWQCIIFIYYIPQPVSTGATKTSQACHGARGLSCTQHDISCNSNQQIAIYDAYYTGNTECGAALSSCTVNPDNVTERGHHRFNNTELVSLYNHCSTETRCVYPAPGRSVALAFSVVRYQCNETDISSHHIAGILLSAALNNRVAWYDVAGSWFTCSFNYVLNEGDLLNISGGVAEGLSQVSLTHGDQRMPNINSTIQTDNYTCSIKSNVAATSISVYAIDARLERGTQRECLSQLSVLPGDVITTNNCSTVFQPFERLNVTAELLTFLNFTDIARSSSTLIWLLINGRLYISDSHLYVIGVYQAVITFSTLEKSTPHEIHDCMSLVNGDTYPSYSTVKRWAAVFKAGGTSLVASDPFDVKCEQAASAGRFTTESTNGRSPISTSVQVPGDFTTAPDKDRYPISISSQFSAGVFVGGVAVGVVIVILVCLAMYVLVVRRRYDLTPKKQGDTPASIEHPNYSGMSPVGDVNNYDIIEQTSGFQGETAHDVAATPDYQNL